MSEDRDGRKDETEVLDDSFLKEARDLVGRAFESRDGKDEAETAPPDRDEPESESETPDGVRLYEDLTDDEKVRALMSAHGFSETRARFHLGLERGETDGDVEAVRTPRSRV